jgi:mono/diheme cytochrome c family protein
VSDRADGDRATRRRCAGLLAAAAAVVLPTAIFWAVAIAAAPGTGAAPEPPPLAVPRKPGIPAGERLYSEACAGCHSDRAIFASRSWRSGRTPAEVTRMLQGAAEGHPAALPDLAQAWDATAYVWTLPDDGPTIRRGEQLALEAERVLRAEVLTVALLHWNDLQDLKNAAWVLNHTEDDVDTLMRRLAGGRYADLQAEDRRALIDYVFASFFTWPSSW